MHNVPNKSKAETRKNETLKLDQTSPSTLEGAPAQAVQGVGEQGDSQPATGGRSGGDLAGDAATGGAVVQTTRGIGNDTGAVLVPSRRTASVKQHNPVTGLANW
jgi:hypothetical protein